MEESLNKLVKVSCVYAILTECLSKKLYGEVQTIIDASALDFESKKAVKSLISQAFTRSGNKIRTEIDKLPEEIVKVMSSVEK